MNAQLLFFFFLHYKSQINKFERNTFLNVYLMVFYLSYRQNTVNFRVMPFIEMQYTNLGWGWGWRGVCEPGGGGG